ncbi:MAG: hypothetical protein CMM80_01390 [Rhodospirillaceae bacterium]|nr:hypothetical protein [Rhodospirillaceae bacterium]
MNRAHVCVAFVAGLFSVLLTDAWGGQFPKSAHGVTNWLALNLGYSAPLFCVALLFVVHSMACLLEELGKDKCCSSRTFHLEHRVDIGISLLFGIGVLFTAIGIRDALTTAIDGEAAAINGGEVLALLVNGGILSAMTTTVVGGALGYSLRVIKVLATGEKLEKVHARMMGEGLQKQEALLQCISSQLKTIGQPRIHERS